MTLFGVKHKKTRIESFLSTIYCHYDGQSAFPYGLADVNNYRQ